MESFALKNMLLGFKKNSQERPLLSTIYADVVLAYLTFENQILFLFLTLNYVHTIYKQLFFQHNMFFCYPI